MTDYLVRFLNAQKFNNAFNGNLIPRGIQEHGMKMLYPLHVTGFDALLEDEKYEAEISGEEMLCAILYIENSNKDRFSDLKKCVDNDCVLDKTK